MLHVTNAWPYEGNPRYGIFVKRQVDALAKIGASGDVLFIRGFESPLAYLAVVLILGRLAIKRSNRYRVVHCHGGEVTPWARAFLRAPVMASYLGSDLLGQRDGGGCVPSRQRWRAKLLRQCSRLTVNTITVSKELEECLPRTVRRRNYVIPDGVDRDLFVPASRHTARRDLGWEPDVPVALFAASAHTPAKRFWLAEAAWRLASEEIPDLRLQVVDDIVPDKMPVVMNAADCLLVTSSSEGSSNVVKEAMACNLPVVSTDVGDVRSLLAEVEPSYVCGSDPWQLASALVACLKGRSRSNGYLHSHSFDSLDVARRIVQVYAGIGGNGPPQR